MRLEILYMIYRNDFRKSSYKHKQIYINENKKIGFEKQCVVCRFVGLNGFLLVALRFDFGTLLIATMAGTKCVAVDSLVLCSGNVLPRH